MDAFIELCTIIFVSGWLLFLAARGGWRTYWSLTARGGWRTYWSLTGRRRH